jgi:hypothetical protein
MAIIIWLGGILIGMPIGVTGAGGASLARLAWRKGERGIALGGLFILQAMGVALADITTLLPVLQVPVLLGAVVGAVLMGSRLAARMQGGR